MTWRTEQLSDSVTLHCGDCREILPTLGKVGRIITDPPYGQAYKVNSYFAGGVRAKAVVQRDGGSCVVDPNIHPEILGDDEPFDPSHLLGVADSILLWGAHKFHDRLPAGSWLFWDKVPTGKLRDQGDGEAAWVNDPGRPMRIFRLLWDGLCVGAGARHEVTAGQKRLHPMQKPVTLMHWCIDQLGGGGTVLDPYMGSGSTGVACVKGGIPFIGIEGVPAYFDIACRRIEAETKQTRLFADAPAAPAPAEQMPLGLGGEA